MRRHSREEDLDAADRMERRELGMGEFRTIEEENVVDDRLHDASEADEDEEWDDLLDEEDR